jgi:Transposase DNA-binding/Transposase DDE domain
MRSPQRVDRRQLAREEVTGAKLGDTRLSVRLEGVAQAVARKPGVSLPEAMGDEAALEGAYRFLGNEKVRPEDILSPHIGLTVKRCSKEQRVLVLFDTTEIRVGGDREELGYLTHEKGRGFLAHVGLAVNAEGGEPLGVLHCETLVRHDLTKKGKKHRGPEKEALRWHRGVAAAHRLVPEGICVMDREADVFTLIQQMDEREQEYIVRAAQNRATPEGTLWELLDDTEVVTTRELELPKQRPRKRATAEKRHPARSAHTATLELRTRRVMLQTAKANHHRAPNPSYVEVNLVHVLELNPPEGDEPVEWILLTNLPCASQREVDFIVDSYCSRWVIEEFFKALKSGCAIEKRQLESVRSMTNMLAVSLPIAWLLLRLRHLSREEPERPAGRLLSSLMLKCLRVLLVARKRRPLSQNPTCRELTWGIAGLGGHITNNGEPGLIVLGRGLTTLLEATAVVEALEAGNL